MMWCDAMSCHMMWCNKAAVLVSYKSSASGSIPCTATLFATYDCIASESSHIARDPIWWSTTIWFFIFIVPLCCPSGITGQCCPTEGSSTAPGVMLGCCPLIKWVVQRSLTAHRTSTTRCSTGYMDTWRGSDTISIPANPDSQTC